MHSMQLVLAALGIIFAAFVKGATGLGFPVIGAPIAALFLDPQTTVVAITIPAFLMNVNQAVQGGVSLALVRRFVPTFLLLVPGAIGGTALLASVPAHLLVLVLGVIVTVYAATALWRLHLVIPPAHERWTGAVAGLCAGMIGGATSMFAPPLVIYLTALQLPKRVFVAAVSICLLVGQIPHLVSLVGFRLLTAPRLGVARALLRTRCLRLPARRVPAAPHQPAGVREGRVGNAPRSGSEPPAHGCPGVALRGTGWQTPPGIGIRR